MNLANCMFGVLLLFLRINTIIGDGDTGESFEFSCDDISNANACNNMPCDCNGGDTDALEDCAVCNQGTGCSECDSGFLKIDFNHGCINCQEYFGDNCLHCTDFTGCQQCADGSDRILDDTCGLYYCADAATPETTVCPGLLAGTPLENEDLDVPDVDTYNAALLTLDLYEVFEDLYDLMLDSQDCWPADEFNGESSYAGLMLRLAWHAAGTFRDTDGAGGSPGGRQRYQPESAWDDNVNLDKARALLAPIKEKYGDALSWGDLMIFAGTAAILQGGGPVTKVCAGRIDEENGRNSDVLNDDSTCNIMGNCSAPLGSSTVGLIYVNPEGFLGNPDPAIAAPHVREVFARMGMNDLESVALIGGGHAFGKCHGPCPDGPGLGPDLAPLNPWPGLCGSDFPEDAYTSGLEGQWTTYPFQWDNEYFTQLLEDNYTLIFGPGNKYQWENQRNGFLMLTTDIAFIYDDDYKAIVEQYAENIYLLDFYFSSAWEKLTTSGNTFAENTFCVDAQELAYDRCNCDDYDGDGDY